MPTSRLRLIPLFATSAAVALSLAACKLDNRPLLARNTAPAAADYAYAPAAAALPYAQPARVFPAGDAYDGYALAQRAYSHDRAAYRTPPEYGFRYGDVEPWVWQTAGDDLMFAEPIDDGYRSYYYEPGASYPYFVRDPQYGYAYGDGGVLTALFDAAGALLPQDRLYGSAEVAGRYLARGQDLRQVYYREPRIPVAEPVWSRRAPALRAFQEPWIAAAERQPAFRERPFRERSDQRVAIAEPPRAFEPRRDRAFDERAFRRHEDRRAFAPEVIPAPAPQLAAREGRGRDRAANVFEHQAQASARVEDHQARDQAREPRREARDQARAVAQAQPPPAQAFERHGGGGGHSDRAAPAAPQAQPQSAGDHGHGAGHDGGRGGDKGDHGDHKR